MILFNTKPGETLKPFPSEEEHSKAIVQLMNNRFKEPGGLTYSKLLGITVWQVALLDDEETVVHMWDSQKGGFLTEYHGKPLDSMMKLTSRR